MYNKLPIRALGLMLAVLAITATLTAVGFEKPSVTCPCSCESCGCELPPGRLFALSKAHLIDVVIQEEGPSGRVVLEGEDAERAVDLLNSFVVVSEKETGWGYINSSGAWVNLYDSRRAFQPIRTQNDVIVGKTQYILEPWCLEEFYKLYDEAMEKGGRDS